jgi:hypothetical protein
MIAGQGVMEGSNSRIFCCRTTNKCSFSAGMYECIFIRPVPHTMYVMRFIPKPLANRSGPQFKINFYEGWHTPLRAVTSNALYTTAVQSPTG